MTMDPKKIGSFLSQLRREQNLTQEQLGERLGVSNKTVSRWENGNYLPPVEMLQQLSGLFSVSINEILCGQRLGEGEYFERAEENIRSALESSSFTAKERLQFHRQKWAKDHLFSTVLLGLLLLFSLLFSYMRRSAVGMLVTCFFVLAFFLVRRNLMAAHAEEMVFGEAKVEKRDHSRLLRRLQVVFLLLLGLGALAAVDLGCNFFFSLIPEANDGITLRSFLGPLLFGDDYWSRKAFFDAFSGSLYLTVFFIFVNILILFLRLKNKKSGP